MTERQKRLIEKVDRRDISLEEFYTAFGADLKKDAGFVRSEVRKAVDSKNMEELDLAIRLIWFSGGDERYVDLLNELLLIPHHRSHQAIAQCLQSIASPTSIPFVRKALALGFDYLSYTGSEPDVIAKWFSWLLAAIGTEEAIEVIREFATSGNEGIRKEMQYRLRKIKE